MPAFTPGMRRLLVEVLTHHQRVDDPPYTGVCSCGLGASFAEHVVDVFEQTWAIQGAL